jgi:hypothetical protein
MVYSWRISCVSFYTHLPLHFCHGITQSSIIINNVSDMTRLLTNLCVMRGVTPWGHLQIYTWRASKETPPWRPTTWANGLYNFCLSTSLTMCTTLGNRALDHVANSTPILQVFTLPPMPPTCVVPTQESISFLPFSHVLPQMTCCHAWIVLRHMCVCESIAKSSYSHVMLNVMCHPIW